MVRSILADLTLEEKVSLLAGRDVWRTVAIDRVGLPSLKVSDGPNGVRGDSTTGARAVCLPASIGLGATFDPDLVAEMGRLLGRETVRKGAHILLAPTINMARHPIGGRNFESFGEEPMLTASMAVAYIEGVQDEGVGACAKHFVANDVEEARLTVSSEIDDATLREVYLHPFEAAVGAGVWSVMAAYPKLKGEHCTEHQWLLTDLLRNEWGFDGLVMSDWGATHTTASVAAGMDLEMPGPASALGGALLDAVVAGTVPEAAVDRAAAAVIEMAVRADRIGKGEEAERSVDLPEERARVRAVAAASMVLLVNRPPVTDANGVDGSEPVLPLPNDLRSLAVVGPNASPGVIQGGGSAQLPAHHHVSPVDGLTEALPDCVVRHEPGVLADRYAPAVPPERWAVPEGETAPVLVEVFDNPEFEGEPIRTRRVAHHHALYQGGNRHAGGARRWSERRTADLPIEVGGRHRFGVLGVGRTRVLVDGRLVADNWTAPQPGEAFFEYGSTEVIGEIELAAGTTARVVVEWSSDSDRTPLSGLRFGHQPPIDEEAQLERAVDAAADADAAVVVVGLTAEWETESHDRPLYGLPGRQDELVRRVVAANPRTVVVVNAGGPIDLPWLDDVPAAVMAWYPGQEFGGALADLLLGVAEPAGRLPCTFPMSLDETPTAGSVPGDGKELHYDEGLFIGHRWYTANDVEPRLPFGHGRSYTEFEFGPARLGPTAPDAALDSAAIVVPVRNVGPRPGVCVVQLYLAPEQPDRPRVLAGFRSVRLEAGASSDVVVPLLAAALRRWDTERRRWVELAGTHRLDVARSSTDVDQELALTLSPNGTLVSEPGEQG